MSEGVELNQGQEGIDNTQCYFTGERNINIPPSNLHRDQMTIPPTTSLPVLPPNSSTKFHQNRTPLFALNQFYPNVPIFHQHVQPSPPYRQQPLQPPQYPLMQPLDDPPASQHSTPIPSESSKGGSRNWSKEEDLQLTIAYFRVSTDSAVGVGQKKLKLWERVRLMFVMLMHEKHRIRPECNLRPSGGCEGRMNEIKSQCTRWIANRARAHRMADSRWSADDVEKLCYQLHEKQGKGPFNWEECWKVLKQTPNWQEGNTKKPKAKRKVPSEGSCMEEYMSNTSTTAATTFQSPNTPVTECTSSDPEIRSNGKSTCTPILDGPGSIDIESPPGTKITKTSNQSQRKIQKHSKSQASASQAIVDTLMSIELMTNSRWARQEEMDRNRDLKDNERYNAMMSMQAKEHELKVGMERAEISEKMEAIGEKLLVAIHKLEQPDPRNLATANHRMMFEYGKKAVDNYERRFKELEKLLERTEFASPPRAPPHDNIASVGTRQTHIFDDEEEPIQLDEDV